VGAALLASTLPIMFIATIAFGYWPHGTLVGFGFETAVLAARAPRLSPSTADPVTYRATASSIGLSEGDPRETGDDHDR
jgi:hypothetical protein